MGCALIVTSTRIKVFSAFAAIQTPSRKGSVTFIHYSMQYIIDEQ